MKNRKNRLSQDDLASAIAKAVKLEKKRIEALAVRQVDAVSGGIMIGDWNDIGTAGRFPTADASDLRR